MFVIVSKYRVRPGEQDAFVAMHEDVGRRQPSLVDGLVSHELLTGVNDASTFVALARYQTREAAESHLRDPNYGDWHQRLVSLSYEPPDIAFFQMAWQDEFSLASAEARPAEIGRKDPEGHP